MKNFSVVVCTYNRHNLVERCLKNILANTLLPNKIIVVDQNLNFLTRDKIINFFKNNNFKNYIIIRNLDKRGLTKSKNISLKYICTKYVFFIDDDIMIKNNYFYENIKLLFKKKGHGSSGVMSNYKSGSINDFFYYISSFLAFFEPISWRWSHANHHSKTRYLDLDLEIADPRPTNLRILLFTEFFGYYRVKAEFIKLIKHSFKIFDKNEHLEGKISVSNLVPEKEMSKMIISSRIFLLIIVATIFLSIYLQSFLPLLLVVTPQMYGGPILWLLAFTQHAGLKFNSNDHRETTRTIILGPILGTFLYSNMQYHIEHHSCPQIPFYNLPKFHDIIKSQLPKPNNGLIDAYLEIIPAIIKQSKYPDYEISKPLPL